MVKNSGQKKRAQHYAAQNHVSYQQARQTLAARQGTDALAALVTQCGSVPLPQGELSSRIPLGQDRDGMMQWANLDDTNLVEVVGDPGTGKTTVLNRIIAHLATETPVPGYIALFAGASEVAGARERWRDWSAVQVIGVPDDGGDPYAELDKFIGPDGLPAAVAVFDDWFTEANGDLLRYQTIGVGYPEGSAPEARDKIVQQVLGADCTLVVAAMGPGHSTQRDETFEIEDAVDYSMARFVAADEFARDPDGLRVPADVLLAPTEKGHVWQRVSDGRPSLNPPSMDGPRSVTVAGTVAPLLMRVEDFYDTLDALGISDDDDRLAWLAAEAEREQDTYARIGRVAS